MYRHVLLLAFILLANGVSTLELSEELIRDIEELKSRERRINPRAIGAGGYQTNPGDFPFVVSLRFPEGAIVDGEDVGGQHLCGGVLIKRNVVLTAGHCLEPNGFYNVEVHVGRYERVGEDEGRFEAFQTVETIIHPEYENKFVWVNFDIALLVLDSESEFPLVKYAEREESIEPGQIGIMLGWGQTIPGDPTSLADTLVKVELPLITREQCRSDIRPSWITDSMICAGEEGRDACRFDSGGPLLHGLTVVGIVSWGFGCAQDTPGVYASVGAVADWIDEQLRNITSRTAGKNEHLVPVSPTVSAPELNANHTGTNHSDTDHSDTNFDANDSNMFIPEILTGCRFVAGRWLGPGCK